jgi:myo-inositol-1(or 4)-monophosphatase
MAVPGVNAAIARPPISDSELHEIEALALELANLAGAEIVTRLGTLFSVEYKSLSPKRAHYSDPVSEVDRNVETLIRARLAERFPDHVIIGEELDEHPTRRHDFVWAVDPIDGTTNFVNGFPFFAASLGVLYRGRPIVGALWSSVSHALRTGVYHGRIGGGLHFDGGPVLAKPNPLVYRGLAGLPNGAPDYANWQTRKTGSAALECALVAAGLMRVARFDTPNIWDVAGGVALVAIAGGEVRERSDEGWREFEEFRVDAADGNLRDWKRSLILGSREAVDAMCDYGRPQPDMKP